MAPYMYNLFPFLLLFFFREGRGGPLDLNLIVVPQVNVHGGLEEIQVKKGRGSATGYFCFGT